MKRRGSKYPTMSGPEPCSPPTSTECQLTEQMFRDFAPREISPDCYLDPLTVKAKSLYQKFEDEYILNQKQEKERTMRATIDTAIDSSLSYIQSRLSQIRYAKRDQIDEMFKEEFPKTIKEGREWLKKGDYRIEPPNYISEDASGHSTMDFFHWGKTAPDYTKWDALKTELQQAYQAAVDEVTIVTDEKARLKVLKEFEAYKIS